MELTINLKVNIQEETEAKKKRAKKAAAKKQVEPIEESWKRIFNMKNTPADLEKLVEVKRALDLGEIPREDTSKRFSKAEALRLWALLREAQREHKIQELIKKTPENYRLVQTTEQFLEMLALLNREELIGLDTETTGVDVYLDDLVGVSLTLPKADIHFYIPVAHDEGEQLDRGYVLGNLKGYFTNKHLKKVLHNAKFDAHILLRYGIRLRGIVHDTMIAM